MALAIVKTKIISTRNSDVRNTIVQFNALCDTLRTICTTLDGDAGVSATNFVATLDAGVSKIGNQAGTAITSTS
jgi:hypothetical protein